MTGALLGRRCWKRNRNAILGPSYFRSQNRNALFLLVLTPQPGTLDSGAPFKELRWKAKPKSPGPQWIE